MKRLATAAAIAGALAAATLAWARGPVETERYRLALPDDFVPLARLSGTPAEDDEVPIVRRAWGDVATGCVGAVHELAAPGARADALHAAVVGGLGDDGLALEETGRDAGDRRYAVSGEVDGLLRVVTGGEPLTAIAALCFWSDRDPAVCRVRCQAFLDDLEILQ